MAVQSLTISIPAYNDSKSLLNLVPEAEQLCVEMGIAVQILIVNDGSSDNTLKVAQEMAAKYQNITIISHEQNLGFGATLKEVFMTPKSEWVLFLPGDNQFSVSNLRKFVAEMDGADYILGYRKLRQDSTKRKIYSKVYNWFVSKLFGFPVKDVNSIVFYRSKIFEHIQLISNSAFVHAEFFLRTSKAGFVTKEVEVSHESRQFGVEAGAKPKVIIETSIELFYYYTKKLL